ncbi:MAG: DUF1631 family protein [Sutterellaceae bacterium]|nr:DUF1631 domain-containing protein [Burkholderiaceae bacterium]MDW8430397.1 DUF1631 family protein [Sutterellaceae bacterium]
MTSDLRTLLGASLQSGALAVSHRLAARRLLEECWTPIRQAIEPKLADVLREALGPLAKSDQEEKAKPAKLILARDKAFLDAFSQSLQAEFKRLVAQFCATDSPARSQSKQALSLVDFDEMEFSTLMERGAARLRNACDEPYTALKLRLANLVREPDLRDAENPFRPVMFLRAVYLALERIGVAAADLLPLTKQFDAPLIAPVAQVYAAVDRYLASQGVSADVQAPVRDCSTVDRATVGGRTAASLTGAATTAGMRSLTGFSAEQMLTALYQHLQLVMPSGAAGTASASPAGPVTAAGPVSSAVAAASGSAMSPLAGAAAKVNSGPPAAAALDPALWAALNEAQRLGALALAAVQRGQPAPDASIDPAQLRARVADRAARQIDKLTIEIVGLLFDRINQDRHVPQKVKELLQRLQFPLIKVALTDPELFVSPHQPARKLLDRIAATSIGWTEEGEHNQRYFAEVHKAVQTVLADKEEGLAPFQRALDEFEKYLQEETTRDDDPVARAKRALAAAEELEVLAINATIKIRSAFDGVLLESYLREFLLETWTRVLVAASLREKVEPGLMRKYLAVVSDLVWSVQPKINPEDRKKLVTTIPPVLTTLREGLRLIDWPQEKVNAFFARLMNSHAQAVKVLELAHGATAPAVEISTLRIKLDGLQLTPETKGALPTSEELPVNDDMIKYALATNGAAVNHLTAERAVPCGEDERLDRQIMGFQRGDWFDLRVGDQTERVQLRWLSPRRALYLFANAEGTRIHSLTPATLRQYLREGRIAPLAGVPLFDRALRDMMEELQRMSGDAGSAAR